MAGKCGVGIFGTESRHGVQKLSLMASPRCCRGITVGGATELRRRCRSADSHFFYCASPTMLGYVNIYGTFRLAISTQKAARD